MKDAILEVKKLSWNFNKENMLDLSFLSEKSVLLFNNEKKALLSKKDEVKMRQVYVHATVDTHGGDFNVLAFITNEGRWLNRSQISKDFFLSLKLRNHDIVESMDNIKRMSY